MVKRMKAEDYDKIDYAKALKLYQERFSDPNNFVFTFVGNIDPATFEPMVEQYLGSLKKQKRNETWKDNGLNLTKKDNICHYEKQMETPKATCYMIYNGAMEYTLKNQLAMQCLNDVMDIVYTEKIREDEGGTYGASAYATVDNGPDACRTLQVAFDTNEDKCDRLRQLAVEGLQRLATDGPTAEEFDKTVKNLEKKIPEKKLSTSYWVSSILNWDKYGVDSVAGYENAVKSLTPEAIKATAKEILFCGNVSEIIMKPQK